MNFKKQVGIRVKAVRTLKNITQEQLSEKIDISPQALSRIERGDNFLSAELLEKLARILQVKPSAFFDFECDWKVEDPDLKEFFIQDTVKIMRNCPDKVDKIHKMVRDLTN